MRANSQPIFGSLIFPLASARQRARAMAAKRGKASTEEEAALKEKYRLLKKMQAVRADDNVTTLRTALARGAQCTRGLALRKSCPIRQAARAVAIALRGSPYLTCGPQEKEAAAADAAKKKDMTAQERLEEAKKALQAQAVRCRFLHRSIARWLVPPSRRPMTVCAFTHS